MLQFTLSHCVCIFNISLFHSNYFAYSHKVFKLFKINNFKCVIYNHFISFHMSGLLLLSTHFLDPCWWGTPILLLMVHKPAFLFFQHGLSTNPDVGAVRDALCRVCYRVGIVVIGHLICVGII